MSRNVDCSVYIGNLDERVSERVLYDILIQAGRVVDLHIPRDKETDRPRGFAFAEYETEEIANYAVKLFSGLVTLYNRTLKFSMSGRDKPSPNMLSASKPISNSSSRSGPFNNLEASPYSARSSASCRFTSQQVNYEQASPRVVHQSNGHRTRIEGNNYGNYRGYNGRY